MEFGHRSYRKARRVILWYDWGGPPQLTLDILHRLRFVHDGHTMVTTGAAWAALRVLWWTLT